jgi:HK97 family phage major capsid protein
MEHRTLEKRARSAHAHIGVALDELREAREAEQRPTGIGMTEEETRRWSYLRAIREVSEMCQAGQPWRLGGIEGDAHRAMERTYGPLASAAAFYVPVEIQHRTLTTAVAGQGGYLVGSTTSGSYIEALRNRSVIFRLGAQSLPGQTANLTLPRLSGTGTATWQSTETTQSSPSNQAFAQVASSPKTVIANTELSRPLILQSNPAVEGVVMTDLGAQVALALDLAALTVTSVSGQPNSIMNTTGIGTFTGTALGLSGLTGAHQSILDANAMLNPQTLGHATTPAVAKLLKNRQRFTGTDSPLWRGALHDGEIEGVRAISSLQLPSATMVYGDWSQVLVPEWGVLAIELNPYANFQAGIVSIRAIWSVDVIVRHAPSFTVGSSIT